MFSGVNNNSSASSQSASTTQAPAGASNPANSNQFAKTASATAANQEVVYSVTDTLLQGVALYSKNERYAFILEDDGNAIMYPVTEDFDPNNSSASHGTAAWQTGNHHNMAHALGAYFRLSHRGVFEKFGSHGDRVWHMGTEGPSSPFYRVEIGEEDASLRLIDGLTGTVLNKIDKDGDHHLASAQSIPDYFANGQDVGPFTSGDTLVGGSGDYIANGDHLVSLTASGDLFTYDQKTKETRILKSTGIIDGKMVLNRQGDFLVRNEAGEQVIFTGAVQGVNREFSLKVSEQGEVLVVDAEAHNAIIWTSDRNRLQDTRTDAELEYKPTVTGSVGGSTSYERDLSKALEAANIYYGVLLDQLGELPASTAQQTFEMILTDKAGGRVRFTDEQWQTFKERNMIDGDYVGDWQLGMLLTNAEDGTSLDEQTVRDAMMSAVFLFSALQTHHKDPNGGTDFIPPSDILQSRHHFAKALVVDTTRSGTTDFLWSRVDLATLQTWEVSKADMNGDGDVTMDDMHLYNTRRQDLESMVIEDFGDGLLTYEKLVKMVGVQTNNWLVREIYEQMANSWEPSRQWQGPTLAQIEDASVVDDFPVTHVSYTQTFNDETIEMEEFVDAKRLAELEGNSAVTITNKEDLGMEQSEQYWKQQILLYYQAHAKSIYNEDGDIISDGNLEARFAHMFRVLINHYIENKALDKKSYPMQTGETIIYNEDLATYETHKEFDDVDGTTLRSFADNIGLTTTDAVSTVTDAEAVAQLHEAFGTSSLANLGIKPVLSLIPANTVSVMEIAGYWAYAADDRHPDFDDKLKNSTRWQIAERNLDSIYGYVKGEMENRGQSIDKLEAEYNAIRDKIENNVAHEKKAQENKETVFIITMVLSGLVLLTGIYSAAATAYAEAAEAALLAREAAMAVDGISTADALLGPGGSAAASSNVVSAYASLTTVSSSVKGAFGVLSLLNFIAAPVGATVFDAGVGITRPPSPSTPNLQGPTTTTATDPNLSIQDILSSFELQETLLQIYDGNESHNQSTGPQAAAQYYLDFFHHDNTVDEHEEIIAQHALNRLLDSGDTDMAAAAAGLHIATLLPDFNPETANTNLAISLVGEGDYTLAAAYMTALPTHQAVDQALAMWSTVATDISPQAAATLAFSTIVDDFANNPNPSVADINPESSAALIQVMATNPTSIGLSADTMEPTLAAMATLSSELTGSLFLEAILDDSIADSAYLVETWFDALDNELFASVIVDMYTIASRSGDLMQLERLDVFVSGLVKGIATSRLLALITTLKPDDAERLSARMREGDEDYRWEIAIRELLYLTNPNQLAETSAADYLTSLPTAEALEFLSLIRSRLGDKRAAELILAIIKQGEPGRVAGLRALMAADHEAMNPVISAMVVIDSELTGSYIGTFMMSLSPSEMLAGASDGSGWTMGLAWLLALPAESLPALVAVIYGFFRDSHPEEAEKFDEIVVLLAEPTGGVPFDDLVAGLTDAERTRLLSLITPDEAPTTAPATLIERIYFLLTLPQGMRPTFLIDFVNDQGNELVASAVATIVNAYDGSDTILSLGATMAAAATATSGSMDGIITAMAESHPQALAHLLSTMLSSPEAADYGTTVAHWLGTLTTTPGTLASVLALMYLYLEKENQATLDGIVSTTLMPKIESNHQPGFFADLLEHFPSPFMVGIVDGLAAGPTGPVTPSPWINIFDELTDAEASTALGTIDTVTSLAILDAIPNASAVWAAMPPATAIPLLVVLWTANPTWAEDIVNDLPPGSATRRSWEALKKLADALGTTIDNAYAELKGNPAGTAALFEDNDNDIVLSHEDQWALILSLPPAEASAAFFAIGPQAKSYIFGIASPSEIMPILVRLDRNMVEIMLTSLLESNPIRKAWEALLAFEAAAESEDTLEGLYADLVDNPSLVLSHAFLGLTPEHQGMLVSALPAPSAGAAMLALHHTYPDVLEAMLLATPPPYIMTGFLSINPEKVTALLDGLSSDSPLRKAWEALTAYAEAKAISPSAAYRYLIDHAATVGESDEFKNLSIATSGALLSGLPPLSAGVIIASLKDEEEAYALTEFMDSATIAAILTTMDVETAAKTFFDIDGAPSFFARVLAALYTINPDLATKLFKGMVERNSSLAAASLLAMNPTSTSGETSIVDAIAIFDALSEDSVQGITDAGKALPDYAVISDQLDPISMAFEAFSEIVAVLGAAGGDSASAYQALIDASPDELATAVSTLITNTNEDDRDLLAYRLTMLIRYLPSAVGGRLFSALASTDTNLSIAVLTTSAVIDGGYPDPLSRTGRLISVVDKDTIKALFDLMEDEVSDRFEWIISADPELKS
ncbi:MAG: hypothetical protein AAFZ92_02510 [Pseudomonadota bacterium]